MRKRQCNRSTDALPCASDEGELTAQIEWVFANHAKLLKQENSFADARGNADRYRFRSRRSVDIV
jgi:hypothetical protein